MYQTIRIEPLNSSIGARVSGVDLSSSIGEEQAAELRLALWENFVLFLSGATTDEGEHMTLARVFGTPIPHPVQFGALGNDELLSNVRTDAYRPGSDSHFHTDYSFHPDTPDVAVLRAVITPSRGGDTFWANMCQAYDALSPSMQSYLEGLDAFHSQGQRFNELMIQYYGEETGRKIAREFPGATHPVVARHPITGRKVLFVNPGYTQSVVGLTDSESRQLLDMLFAHIDNPRFHCRYRWGPGDIAIWDERATLHMGEGTYWPEERELCRITLGSDRPVAAREPLSAGAS